MPTSENDEDYEKQALREKVYQINELAASFYHEELYKPVAKMAQEYVKKRKLDNNNVAIVKADKTEEVIIDESNNKGKNNNIKL